MAKKPNLKEYDLIDLAQTDLSLLTEEELEVYITDTKTVLSAYKRKLTKANLVLALAAGLVDARGGDFDKVTLFVAKYKKGNITKDEKKLVKRAIKTFRFYLVFKVIIVLISQNGGGIKEFSPLLAKKK
jgi:hypothetical protein